MAKGRLEPQRTRGTGGKGKGKGRQDELAGMKLDRIRLVPT
jgi:hypothetical protein